MNEKGLKKGDFVNYKAKHTGVEFGRIKRVTPDGFHAFVVFHCNKEWDNYENYTAARCEIRSLTRTQLK